MIRFRYVLLAFSCLLLLTGCNLFVINEGTAPIPDASQYEYQKLNEREKQAYEIMLAQIPKHAKQINLPTLDGDVLLKVYTAVLYDNPDIICVENTFGWGSYGIGCYIQPKYKFDKDDCSEKREKIDKKVDEILELVDDDMTDLQKELVLHDWLASNCKYSQDETGYDVYDAIIDGEAVCEGYAKAMMLLLNESGINSRLIVGSAQTNGQSIGHMWNVVEIDGNECHLDVTWNATYVQSGIIQHTFFNLSDEQISIDHTDFEELKSDQIENDYYTGNGLFASTKEQVVDIIKEKGTQKRNFEIKVDLPIYSDIVEYLFEEGNISTILSNSGNNDIGRISYFLVEGHGVILLMVE